MSHFSLLEADIPRLYIGEICPTRIREFGIATGAASQWLFNFVLSQITPHAIANIGWRTFVMFCIFNWAISVYSWLLLKEVSDFSLLLIHTFSMLTLSVRAQTKGRSLEEMEIVFGSKETAFDAEATRRKAGEVIAVELER